MELSFGDTEKDGPLTLGMRKRGSFYSVSDASDCVICDADFRLLTGIIRDFFRKSNYAFYNNRKKSGELRNVIIRKAYYTGEILVNIVTTSGVGGLTELTNTILSVTTSGTITGILHTISDSTSDAVKPESVKILHGQPFIHEKLFNLTFKISAFSFFQTNTVGAELLYKTVLDFAGGMDGKTVHDLYCGTGTISILCAANGASDVLGSEIVDEAVEAARENADINKLGEKCKFISGDVLKHLDDIAKTPDIIIVDPPRDGLHPKVLEKIAASKPVMVIYVSCKPQSRARDLPLLAENGYRAEKLKIHDMFPRTAHVETVVLLRRRSH
jgi:23S rRNA (uracil-5-)-methyltransferase RumA